MLSISLVTHTIFSDEPGLEWTEVVDVFAIATIIGELRFGKPLFLGSRDDRHHLAQLHLYLGPMPAELAIPGSKAYASWFKGIDYGKSEAPGDNVSKSKSNGTDAHRSKVQPEAKAVSGSKSKSKIKLESEKESGYKEQAEIVNVDNDAHGDVKDDEPGNIDKDEHGGDDKDGPGADGKGETKGQQINEIVSDDSIIDEKESEKIAIPEFDLENAMTEQEIKEKRGRMRLQKVRLSSLPECNKLTFPYSQNMLINDEVDCAFNHLLKKLLAYDPTLRFSAKKALEHRFFKLNIPLRKYRRF